jgi:hypothetical protein
MEDNDTMKSTIGNFQTKKRIYKLALIFFVCSASLMLMGMGEKYRRPGGVLYHSIINTIIAYGYCSDEQDCYRKEVMFGEHGNRVNLHLYDIHDQELIASILSMVATKGMQITGGVPIMIRFFSKPKKELLGHKSFSASPAITMEVNE